MMCIQTNFSKSDRSTPFHSTHSTYLLKIFFLLLTLSTAFLQKAGGPEKMNKINIIKLFDKQVNDINKNLYIMNKSKIFDKKISSSQNGSGIFSILLPMLASTIIPALIKKGKGNNSNFFETKLKCLELFIKRLQNFIGCFSKDQIQLTENNKSIIINLQNLNQPGSH